MCIRDSTGKGFFYFLFPENLIVIINKDRLIWNQAARCISKFDKEVHGPFAAKRIPGNRKLVYYLRNRERQGNPGAKLEGTI